MGPPSLNPQAIDIMMFSFNISMGPILEITRAISRNSPLSLAAAAAQFCGTQRRHFQDSETMTTGLVGAHTGHINNNDAGLVVHLFLDRMHELKL